MGEYVKVVERVPINHHFCSLPGWWKRRRLNLDYGSIVECATCGQQWKWTTCWTDSSWEKVSPQERVPHGRATH